MQPELFQELELQPRSHRFQMPLFPSRFLRLRVAYEDLIFVVLILVLLLLAGFCLGVERGKRLAVVPLAPIVAPAVVQGVQGVQGESPVVATAPLAVLSEAQRVPLAAAESSSGQQYVIQLASYLDLKAAAAEAQRLGHRGFKAQVVRQGKYYELRVVGYRSREQASVPLAALRRTYRDGFIKRISSG